MNFSHKITNFASKIKGYHYNFYLFFNLVLHQRAVK